MQPELKSGAAQADHGYPSQGTLNESAGWYAGVLNIFLYFKTQSAMI